MILREQTVKDLEVLHNIKVRFYPCSDEKYYQERYEYRYNWLRPYYVCINEIVDGKLVKVDRPDSERCAQAKIYAEKDCKDWYNANKLYITYFDDNKNEIMFVKSENIKSKLITDKYIIDLVDKNKKSYNSYFGDFALKMRKILAENNLNEDLSVYPTTYGIGVWVFYNRNFEKYQQTITDILKNKGVDFKNEYSDMQWVFRFKISKKRNNLLKI